MLRRFLPWLASGILFLAAISPSVRAQESKGDAIASLRATGQVFVNDSPVSGEVTLFAGDAIRTGDNGAAGVTVTGRGTLTIAADTHLSLASGPYFVQLDSGDVIVRTFAGAQTMDVHFGEFVVTEETEVEAAADVRVAADGSAQVRCTEGSIGVINLKGPQSPFLHPGESVSVSSTGAMQVSQPQNVAPAGEQAPPMAPGATVHTGSKTPWIILGVAAAGGGAAAAVLLSKGSSKSTVSPSSP